ncbi:hypothetical protein AVV30_gp003 [Vibrio phage phi 1]|uniref:DUF4326 domain-containing protein n=1 Tax=Vibrio phage phi 1 TaxID=1589297 RepID=A0A0B5GYB5_9CAUD|nr:hypothetical protein AVV30_gp003 [Vibrio phage phi 1]AJF40661.1 hypothetical protein SBVP1_0003 [Vibrio phage phi 1]
MKLITLECHCTFKNSYIFNYLGTSYGRGQSTGNLRIRDIPYPSTFFRKPMKDKSIAERNRVCDLYEDWFKKQANIKGSPARNTMLDLLARAKAGQTINLQCFCRDEVNNRNLHLRCHCETIRNSLLKHLN